MSCEVIKSDLNEFNDCLEMVCNPDGVYVPLDNFVENTYFNIKVQNKKYPSCYQYNLLIMLAKRLLKDETQRESNFTKKWCLDKKTNKEIVNI